MPDFAGAVVEEAPRRGRPPRDPNYTPRSPRATPAPAAEAAPRRRGRPKGSKNKPKASLA